MISGKRNCLRGPSRKRHWRQWGHGRNVADEIAPGLPVRFRHLFPAFGIFEKLSPLLHAHAGESPEKDQTVLLLISGQLLKGLQYFLYLLPFLRRGPLKQSLSND